MNSNLELPADLQRKLLTAIDVTVEQVIENDADAEWQIFRNGQPEDDGFETEEQAWRDAWVYWAADALAHDWHVQSARIAELEAKVSRNGAADAIAWSLIKSMAKVDLNDLEGSTVTGMILFISNTVTRAQAAMTTKESEGQK